MTGLRMEEVRRAEELARDAGWTEGNLLRLAGRRLGWAVGRYFPRMGRVIGYLGKGHNAGDVVVALSVLREEFGWDIAVRCGHSMEDWAPLLKEVWQETGGIRMLDSAPRSSEGRWPCVLLDGLAGVGLYGALREPLAGMAREINRLRREHGFAVAAVDVPSGVDAETGLAGGDAVMADVTFQIANPKIGLMRHEAVNSVGSLAVVPVEPLAYEGAGDFHLVVPQMNREVTVTPHETHKGMSGRVSILAGSRDYTGAAVLCATGAMRAGAGLVFLHVPEDALEFVAARVPAEIIVRGVRSPAEALELDADAFVVGCGLGRWAESHHGELVDGIVRHEKPMVVDADALNRLAVHGEWRKLSVNHVLTPHPGEFRRLAPDLVGLTREQAARAFVEKSQATLLLKGARSLITTQGDGLWANSTGHRSMAKGGQGDLLAGMIGAMHARRMVSHEAACLGAWIAGRCGELTVWEGGQSEETLCPSDAARWAGRAFEDWRAGSR